jgi:hypothetical protein
LTRSDQSHTGPLLIRGDEAETLGDAPNTIQLLADGGTGGAISAVRTGAQGTSGPPPHYHAGAPESFFIIETAPVNVLGRLPAGRRRIIGPRSITWAWWRRSSPSD